MLLGFHRESGGIHASDAAPCAATALWFDGGQAESHDQRSRKLLFAISGAASWTWYDLMILWMIHELCGYSQNVYLYDVRWCFDAIVWSITTNKKRNAKNGDEFCGSIETVPPYPRGESDGPLQIQGHGKTSSATWFSSWTPWGGSWRFFGGGIFWHLSRMLSLFSLVNF